ncbi:hypothetical protein [Flavobacterium granuli]|uniref:Uncharacterized protein n=1 Tax=Flavobacterium granuli TaxID=280093 RepID=A0A1M5U2L2_9FLAO|nr:hypothetical protein [Flavobacterium granuli]PRZ19594.1 hypothetical protein BC624_11513 [Flavobacterium granuli]SHH57188.1 hypothetical protein SAMN05443373_11713 [Flavobacterium granuli]
MKNLELNQMENLEGGISQRNCAVLGAAIALGTIGGFFSFGSSWAFAGAAVLTAANSDCF